MQFENSGFKLYSYSEDMGRNSLRTTNCLNGTDDLKITIDSIQFNMVFTA